VAKFVKLDPQVSVSPQLVAADFAEAAARGFRSVVNNRPDGEAADQLPNAEAAALAQRQRHR
jgi:sulfide:quinone oxidoreductase